MKNEIKKKVLKKLRQKMNQSHGDMMGMGVTVKAKNKEDLLKGLEKAKEVVEMNPLDEMKNEKMKKLKKLFEK